MTGARAGARAGGTFAGNAPTYVSPYPDLHELWEHTEDVAYELGVAAGWQAGRLYGWDEGFRAGFLMPDPPPAGTLGARALERAAVRDALCPGAESLADAIAAFFRDVERARARGGAHHNRHYGVDHDAQTVLGSDGENGQSEQKNRIQGFGPAHPGAWSR